MATRRVIVELRDESADMASALADSPLPGLELDESYEPVPLAAESYEDTAQTAMAAAPPGNTVLVRGEIEEGAEAELEAAQNVVAVWTDAEIAPFPDHDDAPSPAPSHLDLDALLMEAQEGDELGAAPDLATSTPCPPTDCSPSNAKGDLSDAAKILRCDRLWSKGIRGGGVAIGIVDTGVDKTRVANVVDGWSPNPSAPWGTDPGGHGSMCATDALGMAPNAQIYDIGVLKSTGGIAGTISDAIRGFHWALTKYRSAKKPQILSNSWGMYQKAWAPDYATDPNHPFTRKVVEVINAGMMVTFAAGNCGQVCPSGRCGPDSGPGRSIWGANGHPRVMTVGAANIREEWIGYTSQGPAALDEKKPDFCGMSHFKGFYRSDTGTSAANPTVAGVLALLRGHDDKLRQDEAKKALQQTARDLCGDDWDRNSGYGVVNAEAAFNRLNLFETRLVQASWIHGHNTMVEYPDRLTLARPMGFYGLFAGKKGTFNWFHLAIPTPVIVDRRRLRLDSVMLIFATDPNAIVRSVHVYDAASRIQTYDGLEMTGTHWFERFDVLDRRVRYGIGVSVGVQFANAAGNSRIAFLSGGGDFIA